MDSVSDILDRLASATNASSDTELAELLGVKQNTVSSMRARKSLSFERVINIAIRENISLDWLFTGKKSDLPDAAHGMILMEAFEAVRREKSAPAENFSGTAEILNTARLKSELLHLYESIVRIEGRMIAPRRTPPDDVCDDDDCLYIASDIVPFDMKRRKSSDFCQLCGESLKKGDAVFRVTSARHPDAAFHKKCCGFSHDEVQRNIGKMVCAVKKASPQTGWKCIKYEDGGCVVFVSENKDCWCADGLCSDIIHNS